MKFEIVNDAVNEEKTIKARLCVSSNGDLDIYLNDMIIAYICSKSGSLVRVRKGSISDDYKELKEIGIKMEDHESIFRGISGFPIHLLDSIA